MVPGGSTVRAGAYLAPGVICMPPMYVNIGAWVGEGSMIDSHALVGSCAQVGARVVEMLAGSHYHPSWTMIASTALIPTAAEITASNGATISNRRSISIHS